MKTTKTSRPMTETHATINPMRTITVVCPRCDYTEHVTVGAKAETAAICQALDAARYNGCDCKKQVAAVLCHDDSLPPSCPECAS